MTADEFEGLDGLEAELWIARRFHSFVRTGFPPELSLMFAVHPEISADALPTEDAEASTPPFHAAA
jgi:hypothetical protein